MPVICSLALLFALCLNYNADMKTLLIGILLSSSSAFAGDLALSIKGITSKKGQMMIALHSERQSFDSQESGVPYKYKIVKVNSARLEVLFEGLPAGEYAVSIIHDLNNNERLDKNFLGIPKEPFGFSNNPKIFMSAPSYGDCAFRLGTSPTKKEINLVRF